MCSLREGARALIDVRLCLILSLTSSHNAQNDSPTPVVVTVINMHPRDAKQMGQAGEFEFNVLLCNWLFISFLHFHSCVLCFVFGWCYCISLLAFVLTNVCSGDLD